MTALLIFWMPFAPDSITALPSQIPIKGSAPAEGAGAAGFDNDPKAGRLTQPGIEQLPQVHIEAEHQSFDIGTKKSAGLAGIDTAFDPPFAQSMTGVPNATG